MAFNIGTHVRILSGINNQPEASGTVVGYTTFYDEDSEYTNHYCIVELDDGDRNYLKDRDLFVRYLVCHEDNLRRSYVERPLNQRGKE